MQAYFFSLDDSSTAKISPKFTQVSLLTSYMSEGWLLYSLASYPHIRLDHYSFLGNCPPTLLLKQHFVLSEKQMLMLA